MTRINEAVSRPKTPRLKQSRRGWTGPGGELQKCPRALFEIARDARRMATRNAGHKKTPSSVRKLGVFEYRSELTLGVLRTLTRFTQTNFLTLDFTSIAGHVACFTQSLSLIHI